MISKRVKEYIDRHTYNSKEYGDVLLKSTVERAICDAENDMKRLAINSFRQFTDNYCNKAGHYDISENSEYYVIEFAKLLNTTPEVSRGE